MTWTEARSSCQENAPQDADLASIPSQAIHDFLTTLTSENSWVGGYLHPHNGWSWSDNTPWSFESWKPGYPNNYGGNEDSVEINFGQNGDWNDASGAVQRTYICQYKTSTTTPTTITTTTTTTSTTTTTTTTTSTTTTTTKTTTAAQCSGSDCGKITFTFLLWLPDDVTDDQYFSDPCIWRCARA